MSLVHHVCNEASGLESLFLISKSNCAFANFKDEQSCIRAQQKLHDSKFQTVRLVSRLRKSTVEGASGQTAPTGPAATSPGSQAVPPETAISQETPKAAVVSEVVIQVDEDEKSQEQEQQQEQDAAPISNGAQQKDKFFILKSLTVEDLDLSIRNGVWATQSHNEESLNDAFKVCSLRFVTPRCWDFHLIAPLTDDTYYRPPTMYTWYSPQTNQANISGMQGWYHP